MKLYAVNTEEKCDALMRELEAKGIKFGDGSTTEFDCWIIHGSDTVISVAYGSIGYGARKYYEKEYPDIPIIDYVIKKFKVGDRVKHSMFEWEAVVKHMRDNGSFKISDHQLWYYPEYFELIEPPKKPTVPKCLDDWIKENIEDDYDTATRFHVLSYAFIKRQLNDELEEWFTDNKQTALQALEIGYEVEEEPKWIVRAGKNLIFKRFEDVEAIFVIDNQPGAIANVTQFETLEDARNIIDILGDGEAVRVEEDE